MTVDSPAERLRAILATSTPVVPGVWDPLGALIAQHEGAEVAFLSGLSLAASYGLPDVGLTTMTQLVDRAAQVTAATRLPVIVDADQGYGDTTNAKLTLSLLERAGVAGVQIEDQEFPKRCGALEGITLVPAEEMAERIAVLAKARRGSTVLVARSDAILNAGFDECMHRLRAYREAGADIVMPIGPRTDDELAQLGREFPRQWLLLLSTGRDLTPIRPLAEYLPHQPALVVYATATLYDHIGAMTGSIRSLLREGTYRPGPTPPATAGQLELILDGRDGI